MADSLSKTAEQRTKDLKEIGIVIDSWDDIFSDFDPRPLAERTVSGDELTTQIVGIVLMPLGWFGFWEGLSKLIDTSPVVIQDEKLFQKMSKATYHFKYIEEE